MNVGWGVQAMDILPGDCQQVNMPRPTIQVFWRHLLASGTNWTEGAEDWETKETEVFRPSPLRSQKPKHKSD